MNDRWHAIWNRREADAGAALSLDSLIALNGFDVGAGAIGASEWRLNAQRIAFALGIQDGDSVYEVGCGCGAFLLALHEQVDVHVGGADYSSGLIDVARKVFPDSAFDVIAATDMDASDPYDHVLSHSMFHYLSLGDASAVIEKMLAKARRTVGIFDLPDLATRDDAEAMRRGNLPAGEYDKKYEGLAHTYFDKAWLLSEVRRFAPDASVEFMPSQIDNNPQSPFRFGMTVRQAPAAGSKHPSSGNT